MCSKHQQRRVHKAEEHCIKQENTRHRTFTYFEEAYNSLLQLPRVNQSKMQTGVRPNGDCRDEDQLPTMRFDDGISHSAVSMHVPLDHCRHRQYPGQLSLLPSAGREMSTSQSAVMLCGWEVKADMVHSTCV